MIAFLIISTIIGFFILSLLLSDTSPSGLKEFEKKLKEIADITGLVEDATDELIKKG